MRFIYSIIALPFKWLLGGIKVKVYMKSGNVITFRCKQVNFDKKDNKITAYDIKQMMPSAVWMQMDQIEGMIID